MKKRLTSALLALCVRGADVTARDGMGGGDFRLLWGMAQQDLISMKTIYRHLGVVIIAIFCFVPGCTRSPDRSDNDLTLIDIVYNNDNDDFTLYIKENDVYVPYIAISDDYGGGVLLVRKYLLDAYICFNEQKSHGSVGGYYPDSRVDQYLTDVFLSQFSTAMQDAILQTPVEVSTVRAVMSGGAVRETETISRKVFLLSATEMNIKSGMAGQEGKALSYFKGSKNYVVCTEDGVEDAYWLRSAYLWDDIQAWAIGADGKYGGCAVSLSYSLRPAFCLDKDTQIKTNPDVDPGKTVYTVE